MQASLCPLPPLVYGDGSRVTQILVNLLGNAVKYSPPNAGPIALSLEIADALPSPNEKCDSEAENGPSKDLSPSKKRKVTAIFRVSDHGVGVEKEHRNSIFLQWTQVRENASFAERLICKKLIFQSEL